MNICQIVPYFPYMEHIAGQAIEDGYNVGGVERHVYHISKELSKRGHNVTVISTKSPIHKELSEIEGFTIKRVPVILRIYNSHIPIEILRHFDPNQYDLIHAHTPVPVMADLAALKNVTRKIPFVLTYHNDIVKAGFIGKLVTLAYSNTAGKFLLKHSDIIISTTKTYASNSKQLNGHSKKVRIIPNGVNIEIFNPKLDGRWVKEKYGLTDDCRLILFVGRLDYYKGCDYLVRAFSRVVKRLPNARLMFVGEGPIKDELWKIANNLHTIEHISFAGYIRDELLPFYYAASTVFVLPSISPYEGFGIVQLEAMACAKPVVTTTIPGVSEIDSSEVATLHVPPKDEINLADSLIKLLEDGGLAIRMGKKGRQLVLDNYSWIKVADSLENVYGGLIKGY